MVNFRTVEKSENPESGIKAVLETFPSTFLPRPPLPLQPTPYRCRAEYEWYLQGSENSIFGEKL